jgi:hypothetical protein
MAEAERYVNWWKIKEFVREALGVTGDSKYDPTKPCTFEQLVDAAQRVSDQFEEFSTQECGKVRKGFLAMPGGMSGRVRLSHLHNAVLNGDGGFAESTEYLRRLGAVDDSDPAVPHVLLPNYMASPSNCLATTSFFDLCCPSECESIVEGLERKIAAPDAAIDQVVAAVDGNNSLSASTLADLQEVARAHGGRVSLHGFAFAEWLHHVFPRDCPRPRAENYVGARPHDDAGEVPTATQEFQGVAELKTMADITASAEELALEKLELEALEQKSLSEGNASAGAAWSADGLTPGVRAMADLAQTASASPALDMMRPKRLERALLSEVEAVLSGSHVEIAAERVAQIEQQMRAMFMSLPKNTYGRIEHDAARYAMFQRFSRRRGWQVHSLNPAGEAQAPSSKNEELRGKVPVHLLTLLEEKQDGRGLGLRELTAIIATLEHLISGDTEQRLKAGYYAHRLSPDSPISQSEAADAIKTFMAHFVSLEHRSGYAMTPEASEKERMYIAKNYPGWSKVVSDVDRALRRNAVDNHGAPLSFADTRRAAEDVMDRYEEQSASECVDLKRDFAALPNGTSGSVLLSDLHRVALQGKGLFRESTTYLRKAGALDESSPHAPRVLLPNYLYSASNCLGTSSFIDVCCPNECDLILEHLEQRLQAPEVAAIDVASAFTSLRPVPPEALTSLDAVARSHGGRLPIHGHGFADWLHSTFPSECPRRRAEDFTHKNARPGHDEEDEVLGSEREYQESAYLKSLDDIAASTEELKFEAKVFQAAASLEENASIPELMERARAGALVEDDGLDLAAHWAAQQKVTLGMTRPAFDAASFAQTGVQVEEPSKRKEEI